MFVYDEQTGVAADESETNPYITPPSPTKIGKPVFILNVPIVHYDVRRYKGGNRL